MMHSEYSPVSSVPSEQQHSSKLLTTTIPAVTSTKPSKPWIRGVNLGGWLVLERYITPYQFAITDCHLRGEYCWYPGALSSPSNMTDKSICNLNRCHPHRTTVVHGNNDYPIDEWTLGKAFLDAYQSPETNMTQRPPEGIAIAEQWMDYHFENFISVMDIEALARAGATHIRVPLPHFILGDVTPDEPWIVGSRWKYFLQMCRIARQNNLQVWPDIHTSPGSQNGFDNSGHQNNDWATCSGWSNDPENVRRTLNAIDSITKAIAIEALNDVVTGFGLLNEPFKDCNRQLYEKFLEDGKRIVRNNLGESTSIYVSDMFLASTFNDGTWWLGRDTKGKTNTRLSSSIGDIPNEPAPGSNTLLSEPYHDTYLDSHYYQVFDPMTRKFTPAQHIAFACQQQYKDSVSCCYERDYSLWSFLTGRYGQDKRISEHGVRRIFGEWSAAYDILPSDKLRDMMQSIAENGSVIEFDRQLSISQKQFMLHFVQAQMVVFESQQVGISEGWFYWTAKMEGGAFAEWDFLRGISEEWIPSIPSSDVSSESIYGSCYDILLRTNDTDAAIAEVIQPFPNPDTLPSWMSGSSPDDDVVISHGKSLVDKKGHYPLYPPSPLVHNGGIFSDSTVYYYGPSHHITEWVVGVIALFLLIFVCRFVYRNIRFSTSNSVKDVTNHYGDNRKYQYTPITAEVATTTTVKGIEIDC